MVSWETGRGAECAFSRSMHALLQTGSIQQCYCTICQLPSRALLSGLGWRRLSTRRFPSEGPQPLTKRGYWRLHAGQAGENEYCQKRIRSWVGWSERRERYIDRRARETLERRLRHFLVFHPASHLSADKRAVLLRRRLPSYRQTTRLAPASQPARQTDRRTDGQTAQTAFPRWSPRARETANPELRAQRSVNRRRNTARPSHLPYRRERREERPSMQFTRRTQRQRSRMAVIEQFKNFLRHGKQARVEPPHGDPTTNVSNVHAQHQPHIGVSEPAVGHQPLQGATHEKNFSAAAVDNRNIAAQAGDVAARNAADKHNAQAHAAAGTKERKDIDPSVLERIVAEEREAKGKLPKYPGLERWKLLEKMGDGAFSNVYRATDSTGQYGEVAIKVVRKFEMNSSQGDAHMHPDFKKAPKTVERANILKEVQIMRQLDHPNIVKLIDFSESRQYYYIILELCPGGELFHQIVRLTYFSEDLSRHVIVQVAKALEYLHEEAGVVHRDIKPENLLFYPTPFIPTRHPKPRGPDDEDKADEGEFIKGVGSGGIGVIKIADFGLSKVIWDSQTMTPCGTVGYTAPEIVKDERYSKSVDMWALGCVLYTLLCGFPPFYDESIQTLTEKVARGQYTFLSPWWDDISKPAQDLVSHLLTVDPEKRYDIKQFLNHPWIREADELTYAAHDAPPLATPALRQKEVDQSGVQPLQPNFAYLESPGARRQDFRSPGAVNLREVFDVGYAVHRQEEEGKRRKNFKQGYRGANAINSLNALDENEDDDEYTAESVPYDPSQQHPPAKLPKSQGNDVSSMEQKLRNTTLSAAAQARQPRQERGYGQHSPAVAAAAKRQVKSKGAFELSLDNATLLGRRHKKPEPSGLREQVTAGGT